MTARTGVTKEAEVLHTSEQSDASKCTNVVSEFFVSAYESGIKRPLDSVKQIAGMKTKPAAAQENLSGMMNISHVVGSATGQIVDFLVLTKLTGFGLRKTAGALAESSLVSKELTEGTFAHAALTSGSAGFINGALLTPVADGDGISARIKTGVVDAGSFAAMGVVGARYKNQFGNNLLGRAQLNALSGFAGGATNSVLESISHGQAPNALGVTQNALNWSLGAVFAGESLRTLGQTANVIKDFGIAGASTVRLSAPLELSSESVSSSYRAARRINNSGAILENKPPATDNPTTNNESSETRAIKVLPDLPAPAVRTFTEASPPVYLTRAPEVADTLVRNFKSEEWLGGSLQHRTNMLFSTFNDLNTSLRLPKLVSLTSKNASFFADGSSEIGQYRINIDTDFFKPGKEQELAELGSHEVTHGSDQDYVVARLIADRLAMGRVPAARQLQQFSDDFSNFMFTKPTPRFVINTMVAREGQQLSAPEIDRAERLIASHQNQALFIIKDQILGDIEPAIEASIYKLSEGYPCWKWLAEAMAPLAVPTENVVTRIATFTPGVIPVARAAGVRVELLQATPQQLLGQMPEIQRLASQVRRDSNGNPIPWAGRGFADDKPTGIELTVLEKLETALMNRLTVIRKAPKLGFGTLFDREYADRFHESEAIQTGVTIGNIVGEILSGKILPKPSSSPPSR